MEQYLGNGNGQDGEVVLSSHSPIDAQCSGSVGTNTLAASNVQFAAGQFIKIRQEKGTNYGKQEVNKIASYNHGSGQITTVNKLKYNYSSSGIDRAQVIVMPQYSKVTITSGFNIKAWNDAVGAHLTFLCSGRVINNSGALVNGVGRGFRGGDRENSGSPPATAESGDSPTGNPHRTALTNNGMAGGGASDRNAGEGDTGGGAGNATVGTHNPVVGGDFTGEFGTAVPSTELLDYFVMGAGGGGGVGPGGNDRGGFGGSGGATFDIYCFEFVNNGTINISGNNGNTQSNYGSYTDGGDPNPGGSQGCGGGGGASGDGRVTCTKFTNTGSILLNGGIGGHTNNSSKPRGGNGSVGVLGIRCCSYVNTGTISAFLVLVRGGYPFCGTAVQIM